MPTPQELAILRNNVLNSFEDYSRLSQLGMLGNQMAPIAQMGQDFTLEDKGAVFLSAMLNEFFSVSADKKVYRTILGQANGYVDRENGEGGRAWGLVRSNLLEIGTAHGWSNTSTLYQDWTPGQREQFSEMIENDLPKKGAGCYVATAVYGSYDCPEVWMLRRFRDRSLMTTRLGRALVRAYYAASPIAVRRGGAPLRALAHPPLKVLVRTLRARGVSDSPYVDQL